MRGEENDGSRYAMIFVRDITDARKEMENILELTRKNDATDLLLQGTMRLVSRFAMCNLEDDTYKFIVCTKKCHHTMLAEHIMT